MSRFCLSASFVAAIAAFGCATEEAAPVDFNADTGGVATTAVEARVVAEFTTKEGATLKFMNENDASADPLISVEIFSPDSTPIVDALLAQEPSALELYLALQPQATAPEELVREHRLYAAADPSVSAQPRVLTTNVPSSIVESFSCQNNYAGWLAAFTAWAPALGGPGSPYTAVNTGTTTGYVGYAPKFYFDVCRITASPYAYAVRTERRSNSGAAWGVIDNGSPLGLNQRYRFYRNSFTCSSFQHRLYVNPVGGSYYRGAAWSDEWSCQISG
jgi:hypothetical protein